MASVDSVDPSFDRTESLIGKDAFEKLKAASVLVVGLGGVGGAAFEVLLRSGIGRLTVVDGDAFEPTNINRQILCTLGEIGSSKACAAVRRAAAINPKAQVTAVEQFLTAETCDGILGSGKFDYCIDAIDDACAKVELARSCARTSIPLIAAMGAGNRLDCTFKVCDVCETSGDPFARKMRKLYREAGIEGLDVVCAASPPSVRSATPFSIAAPPIVMGATLANFVIARLIEA